MTNDREKLLKNFLIESGWGNAKRGNLAGDASFRRYERLKNAEKTAVLMDAAPTSHEDIRPFMCVAAYLFSHGFSSPAIIANDIENGFLILEDFGDDLFNNLVLCDAALEEKLYKNAIKVLASLHKCELPQNIPDYDNVMLLKECMLFAKWYLPLIGKKCDAEEYAALWNDILPLMQAGDKVTVLRDYHADNLIWLPERSGIKKVGLLDFQDAVIGSTAYDVVSLLEDARRDVSISFAEEMLDYYFLLRPDVNKCEFLTLYALSGAQRNCKILGIFARLAVRDKKPSYLQFLPRVWRYLEHDIRHDNLSHLKLWLDDVVPQTIRVEIPEYD